MPRSPLLTFLKMLALLQMDIGFIGIGHLSENWRNHHGVQVLVLLTTDQHAPICFLVFYCFQQPGEKKVGERFK